MRQRQTETDRQRVKLSSLCKSEERGELWSARKNRTTEKKSSVGRDLRKSPKKRL